MTVERNQIDEAKFNSKAVLPFELRLKDFAMAMEDVYDFFHDVNVGLVERGLERLDDMLRPAIMSGLLSDMLTASLTFTEIYLGLVSRKDFRKNPRGELGTRTATLDREGIEKLRQNWIYRLNK